MDGVGSLDGYGMMGGDFELWVDWLGPSYQRWVSWGTMGTMCLVFCLVFVVRADAWSMPCVAEKKEQSAFIHGKTHRERKQTPCANHNIKNNNKIMII